MAIHTLNYISFCTGIGGLDLGLHLATGGNARPLAYVEREGFAVATLVDAITQGRLGSAPIHSDVRSFPGYLFANKVDLIVAGYPCQPFSLAGKRGGGDDSRHLWPSILRNVAETNATMVFLENVPGHVSLGLETVQRDLENLGFRCAGILLRASDIGAPHKRERLFILAARLANGLHERLSLLCQGIHNNGSEEVSYGSNVDRCDPELDLVSDPNSHAIRVESERSQWEGRQVREAECEYSESMVIGQKGCPPFPPLPEDAEGWQDYLRLWPETNPAIEPCIRCGVDGIPAQLVRNRVDQLRAYGNSVVPLQAAKALTILSSEMLNCLELV